MAGAGQAAAAEDADGHLEVAAELLAHHVGGDLRSAEDGVQAVVDRHVFVDAVEPVGVVPALFEFLQRQVIRTIAVDLVGAGEAERRILAEVARRHQHVHGADGVDVEIVVGNGGGLVVRRLRGGVDDEIGPLGVEQIAHPLAIANVEIGMAVVRHGIDQVAHHLAGRAGGSEELLPHVVIHAHHAPAVLGEHADAFGADQSSGTGNQYFFHEVCFRFGW